MASKHTDSNLPHRGKRSVRRHHTQLKSYDQDADNLNRLEAMTQFTDGRSITPEEGKRVTHLSASEQKEFTRVMNIADSFLRKSVTP